MYLCHKCGGILLHDKTEDVSGLLDCQCMSGYYRGFEPCLTRTQAIAKQIEHQDSWIALYAQQGRTDSEIAVKEVKKQRLLELK